MNHKVNNVQQLYIDSEKLYNDCVLKTADTLIDDLSQGINILKGCWEGADAGIQIQNVIEVHNSLVFIRNILAKLARDASSIASRYREIQNANRANLENLPVISINEKQIMSEYSDTRDTINITEEANNGKNKIDTANNNIDGFISEVKRYYNNIIDNWQMGQGREKAVEAFEDFLAKSNNYKNTLSDVSASITDAIKNYSF